MRDEVETEVRRHSVGTVRGRCQSHGLREWNKEFIPAKVPVATFTVSFQHVAMVATLDPINVATGLQKTFKGLAVITGGNGFGVCQAGKVSTVNDLTTVAVNCGGFIGWLWALWLGRQAFDHGVGVFDSLHQIVFLVTGFKPIVGGLQVSRFFGPDIVGSRKNFVT